MYAYMHMWQFYIIQRSLFELLKNFYFHTCTTLKKKEKAAFYGTILFEEIMYIIFIINVNNFKRDIITNQVNNKIIYLK